MTKEAILFSILVLTVIFVVWYLRNKMLSKEKELDPPIIPMTVGYNAKQERIIQKYSSKQAYWVFNVLSYILIFITILTKTAGVIEILVMLTMYYLSFNLLKDKLKLNVWLAMFAAFIIALISLILTFYVLFEILKRNI